MISVLRKGGTQIHIAPEEPGHGVSAYTLCLRKWSRRAPVREDSRICEECFMKWRASVLQHIDKTERAQHDKS